MKVILINGGPRVNGATGKVVKEIEAYLKAKGDVDVSSHALSDYNMKFCKGCGYCDVHGSCAIKDDGINGLIKEVENSDGIVFASPTYISSVTGQMKTFFDRAHIFVCEQSLIGKYGFSVTTYETADGDKAIGYMENFFLVTGASRKGNYSLMLNFNSDPFAKVTTKNDIRHKMDRFYNAVKTGEKRTLFERLFNKILVHVFFKPFYMKNQDRYARILKLWKDRKLI